MLTTMAEYANLAYCSETNKFGELGIKDAFVNIIQHLESKEIICYFKGLHFSREELSNRVPNFSGYRTRSGYVDTEWMGHSIKIAKLIMKKILDFLIKTPGIHKKVYFTGHGVGGVYAVLAGLYILESYYEKVLPELSKPLIVEFLAITFGQPRIGTSQFACLINKRLKVYRVTIYNDYFPHFPIGNDKMIEVHHDTEYWISEEDCYCSNQIEGNSQLKYQSKIYECLNDNGQLFEKKEKENLKGNLGTDGLGELVHFGPYFALKIQYLFLQDGNLTFPIVVDRKNQIRVPFQFKQTTKRSQSLPKTLLDPEKSFFGLYKVLAYYANDAYCNLENGFINVEFGSFSSPSLNTALVVYFAGPKRKKNSWRTEIDRQILFQVKGFPTFDDNAPYASIAGILWTIQRYGIYKSKLWPEIDLNKIGHHLITFGAPRIGNSRFSRFANKAIRHYRITHGNDHVPHFPSDSLEWNHFGVEIWIEPLENCNCLDDDVNFHPYSYWDCNNQLLERTQRQIWLEKLTSENMECNKGQSIINVPDDLFHDGPYFDIRMGVCS
ncbi:hypothetical protein G9A89_008629 [Geosiphon pyriformis]|nr:hypothetical protein G9A89_008629 [Geosiphon pyriformis]